MRLLVGFDGSDGGRDALELARVLGSEPGSSALVAAVLFGGPLPVDLAGLGEEEALEAEPIFEEARAKLDGFAVETRAFGGASPGAILTVLAEAEGFDAIVVGSPHRGPVGRVLIGSVGHNLLNGAPCDVFVAPKGYAEEERSAFRAIAVAFDGTPEARAALRRAEELAHRSKATIRVLTVVSHPVVATVPGAVGGGYVAESPPEPDRVVREAVDSIDPELDARGQRLEGPAAQKIVDSLGEDEADLLVTGSRGYGPGMRVLLGSVSRKLIADAPCPVLVVPRP
jgi:nucleotide-binding universal stress UspA family protein